MAGPGGGPSRRSHTKSRNGCENCKRRHIRCDENFPQCTACTKHKVQCPYNLATSSPTATATPHDRLDLMWTAEIEADITAWQTSGAFPFQHVLPCPVSDPKSWSVDDLRLIHYLASTYSDLEAIGANTFALWTRLLPPIFAMASSESYVMDALLAFSAEHIAFLNGCAAVGNRAYEHRGNALKGLQVAISQFSSQKLDTILAASLVLSWQGSHWRDSTKLMDGAVSIIGAMGPWKKASQFADFIDKSTTTLGVAPPVSAQADHKSTELHSEGTVAIQRMIDQLARVETYMKQNKEDPHPIQQLASFLKGARKVSPSQALVDQLDRLRPLRTWLFWTPVTCLGAQGCTPSVLLVIAHYYATAMLMERLFPEIGAGYIGSLGIQPVEDIERQLATMPASRRQGDAPSPLALMEFPMSIIRPFRSGLGLEFPNSSQLVSPVSGSVSPLPMYGTPDYGTSDYGARDCHATGLHTPPDTSTVYYSSSSGMPAGPNAGLAIRIDDSDITGASFLVPECGGSSMPSPLSFNGQYPGTSSPSIATYSPASTFADSWADPVEHSLDFAGPHNFGSDFANCRPVTSANTMKLNTFAPSHRPRGSLQHWKADTPSYYNGPPTPPCPLLPSPQNLQPGRFSHHRHSSSVQSAPLPIIEREWLEG
ncbi:hypothetical protein GGS20DRAFT_390317 [Poronia punctata]|nr:hypothetical protein GGS20DRAFT_390317 [Poronia punctata]